MLGPGVKKVRLAVGRVLACLLWVAAVAALVALHEQWSAQPGLPSIPVLYWVLVVGVLLAVVVHELGHLVACLALGVKVRAFRLGNQPAPIRFWVGKVHVTLNWASHGRVEHDGTPSTWRRAVITLAGPLADLVVAGVLAGLLALSPTSLGGSAGRLAGWTIAMAFGLVGLTNLLPFRTRGGHLSDGERLLRVRSQGDVAGLARVCREMARLRAAHRAGEALELHAGADIADGPLTAAEAGLLVRIEWDAASLPGLPADAAALAERRLDSVVGQPDLIGSVPLALLTLALVGLHQRRFGDVESLCAQVLASPKLPRSLRIHSLAMTAVAGQELGKAQREATAEDAALELDVEARAGSLKWIVDPEGMLAVFRNGDRAAMLGAGEIAPWLRRQGRVDDLVNLHRGFRLDPDDPNLRVLLSSLHCVEDAVVLVPGMPADVIEMAGRRLEFVLEKYPYGEKDSSVRRAAIKHSLAVARLRQGRLREVEGLCQAGLESDIGPEMRATVLATVVLARRGLGRRYKRQLAEAVALAPDADLVAEAAAQVPLQPMPATPV
jgi:Zn-dependent protease